MTEAYTDGAVLGKSEAGWGVLITGQPEHRYHGVVDTHDVMVAELWAALMAVRFAPWGQHLRVHTDAQSLPGLIGGQPTERVDLTNIAAKVRREAGKRQIRLSCAWAPREGPEQLRAHELAQAGRARGRVAGAPPHLLIQAHGEALELLVSWVTPRITRELIVTWVDENSETAAAQALALLKKQALATVQLFEVPASLLEARGQLLRVVHAEAERYGTTLEVRT